MAAAKKREEEVVFVPKRTPFPFPNLKLIRKIIKTNIPPKIAHMSRAWSPEISKIILQLGPIRSKTEQPLFSHTAIRHGHVVTAAPEFCICKLPLISFNIHHFLLVT